MRSRMKSRPWIAVRSKAACGPALHPLSPAAKMKKSPVSRRVTVVDATGQQLPLGQHLARLTPCQAIAVLPPLAFVATEPPNTPLAVLVSDPLTLLGHAQHAPVPRYRDDNSPYFA